MCIYVYMSIYIYMGTHIPYTHTWDVCVCVGGWVGGCVWVGWVCCAGRGHAHKNSYKAVVIGPNRLQLYMYIFMYIYM